MLKYFSLQLPSAAIMLSITAPPTLHLPITNIISEDAASASRGAQIATAV